MVREGHDKLVNTLLRKPENRVRKRARAAWLVGVFLLMCHTLQARSDEVQSSQVERGKQLYEFYCYQCHGYSGNANTVAARFLADPRVLTRERMLSVVRTGRAGTAMTSFSRVLTAEDMAAVIDYVATQLISTDKRDLRYHTAENGWSNHQRYELAFEFALGKLPISTPWERLGPRQRIGKNLFLSACITCHEASSLDGDPLQWELRAVSYPRSTDTCVDCHAARPRELLPLTGATQNAIGLKGESSAPSGNFTASPLLTHTQPQQDTALSEAQVRGKAVFLANCAFCHAADGSGRNWIGSFLQPRPRDLRRDYFGTKSGSELIKVIRDGISGTSMPAWKNVLTEREIHDLVDFLAIDAHLPAASAPGAAMKSTQSDDALPQWIKRPVNH